jgi:hypothetical protein
MTDRDEYTPRQASGGAEGRRKADAHSHCASRRTSLAGIYRPGASARMSACRRMFNRFAGMRSPYA